MVLKTNKNQANTNDASSPFGPFPVIPHIATMFMNKLSGEGLFDERPTTQMSLGRFVL